MRILLLGAILACCFGDNSILIQRACAINAKLKMCRTATRRASKFGSLISLSADSFDEGSIERIPESQESEDAKTISKEDANENNAMHDSNHTVKVFISDYCVNNRNRFVQKCYGEVENAQIPFCKSYPNACSSIGDVIPVMTYCARYFKKYRSLCSGGETNPTSEQFCYAFEQFCLPPIHNEAHEVSTPAPVLQRCEDVVKEARQVCDPMPDEADQFNFVRCSRFIEKCKKYIDWE